MSYLHCGATLTLWQSSWKVFIMVFGLFKKNLKHSLFFQLCSNTWRQVVLFHFHSQPLNEPGGRISVVGYLSHWTDTPGVSYLNLSSYCSLRFLGFQKHHKYTNLGSLYPYLKKWAWWWKVPGRCPYWTCTRSSWWHCRLRHPSHTGVPGLCHCLRGPPHPCRHCTSLAEEQGENTEIPRCFNSRSEVLQKASQMWTWNPYALQSEVTDRNRDSKH